jgi:putative solute:sodium symporter small subunit
MSNDSDAAGTRRAEYWRRTLVLTTVSLAIWFIVTYVVAFFAVPLNNVSFFGFPLAFYIGAQGAILVYLALIVFYARYMNRLDREFGVAEED